MLRAFLVGARSAAQRWPLVVVLGLITALFGLAFALASGAWLGEALEGSLATRMLLQRIDPDVLVDLWYHHREGLYVLLLLAAALAVVHSVLWWWLHGVVIAALLPPEERLSIWTRGLELVPVMARLFALALIVLALFSAAVGGSAYGLLRWTRSSPDALVWYQIGGVAAGLWLLGFVFLVAVHDHARLRAARSGDGALPSYRWAFAFVLHGGERAFALACALQLSSLLVWMAYQAIGVTFPMTLLLGLSVTLLWGEAYLWLRMWVRVWFFAAQNELQR